MSKADSLNGLAHTIAKRLKSVDEIYNGSPPAGEHAKQFKYLCDRADLASGPVTTRQMAYLATELVPEQLARFKGSAT